jgi:hypothetical protein
MEAQRESESDSSNSECEEMEKRFIFKKMPSCPNTQQITMDQPNETDEELIK